MRCALVFRFAGGPVGCEFLDQEFYRWGLLPAQRTGQHTLLGFVAGPIQFDKSAQVIAFAQSQNQGGVKRRS